MRCTGRQWDARGLLREAWLEARKCEATHALSLRVDEVGRWYDASDLHLLDLDGCVDIDIWPTPLTDSFPLWRAKLQVGQRREFHMASVSAPKLSVQAKAQAYTRLADRRYCFERLDESGFRAELALDQDGFVIDYPGLFRRVRVGNT
ncbi:putative glycolipid-binding domain-containing protein [Roseateles sp. NT4]|uniref:putative glycolipid-binding domain-containing protein n=1 Tax=Roseateles sp. NT4 TaxID=3453715 RepID=UPI003EEE0692